MKYIYLDTSHIQKWENGTLGKPEIARLNELSTKSISFVFSDIHFLEITHRTDRLHIKEIFNFISKLPCYVMPDLIELFDIEIKHAFSLFQGTKSPAVSPLIKINNDYFSEENIDQYVTTYEQQHLMHSKMNKDIRGFHDRCRDESKKLYKNQFKSRIEDALYHRIKAAIKNSNIELHYNSEESFIKFLIGNQELARALKINFYADLYFLRDAHKEINDWFDVSHFSYAPYVNFLSIDKDSHRHIKGAISKSKITMDTVISANINELLDQCC